MNRTRALAVALALPLVVGACGGDNGGGGGLDRNNPEAVALAYVRSYYDCGERGAGLRWNLAVHTGGEDETSRADELAAERDQGCSPKRVPAIKVYRGGSLGDVTEVVVVNPDACTPDRVIIRLLRSADGFSVDTSANSDKSDCVRNGST